MKKIFSLLLVFVFAFSTVSFFSGCSTTEGNNSIVANTIENIFTSALTIASNIIASDGTQQLAISAVESYLSGVITDPEQLEIINQIIEEAIPELANGITSSSSKVALNKDMSKKMRVETIVNSYTDSTEFKKLIVKCLEKYNQRR